MARKYLAKLDQLAPATASRIVDKMPDNFNLLGLIALLWPKARVILCSRDLRRRPILLANVVRHEPLDQQLGAHRTAIC